MGQVEPTAENPRIQKFIDTRVRDEPSTFTLGRKEVPQGLEIAVASMMEGNSHLFLYSPLDGCYYPFWLIIGKS